MKDERVLVFIFLGILRVLGIIGEGACFFVWVRLVELGSYGDVNKFEGSIFRKLVFGVLVSGIF